MKTSYRTSKFNRIPRNHLAMLSAVAALSAFTVKADTYFWQGGTASYTVAADWNSGVVPVLTNSAVSANGAGNIVQVNVGDPDWTLGDLSAGGAMGATGEIDQYGQNVNVNGWMHIGDGTNSFGTYVLNGGTLNQTNTGNQFFLGEGPGSTSELNINGGTINIGGTFHIVDGGWNGSTPRSGVVNQNAGTVNAYGVMEVGVSAGGTAVYNFASGAINLSPTTDNQLIVGNIGGTGTLNMSGGAINSPAAEFWIGNSGGSVGVVNLSGNAVVNVNNWIAPGRGGSGTLNISNNAVLSKTGTGNNFTIGSNIGGAGNGFVNQYGGFVTNTSSQTWIGETANGTWNMNGGTAILGQVFVRYSSSASGILRLNGGLFQTTGISAVASTANGNELIFNGGVLQASANNTAFISGIDQGFALISSGGAVIDSQNYNITIPQELDDDGGGLIKLGSGTLTLTGPNTYSGDTIVSNGTLIVSTIAGGSAINYTAVDGTAFGVTVASANGQVQAANLTMGNSAGATLNFDLGNFGDPTSAPLVVSGAAAANGVITINIADALPQVGEFPLIQLSSPVSGSGSFVLGSLPTGITANLLTNATTGNIDLNIATVNLPVWAGLAGGNWDIGLTTNWINAGSGSPTFYTDGSAVQFNDTAPGTTTVNLVAAVSPKSTLFTNSVLPYTVTGTGSIGGSGGLTKQGSAPLTINNTGGNTYIGPTVITGGMLSVTNLANGGSPSAIGASTASAANLVISNATFQYSGAPVTINRGYSAQGTATVVAATPAGFPAPATTIDAEGNLTLTGTAQSSGFLAKTGPATLTYAGVGTNVLSSVAGNGAFMVVDGTVVFDGSAGAQTNIEVGQLYVGSATNSAANFILTNTSFGSSDWFALGRGNGNSNFLSTATVYNSTFNISYGDTGTAGGGGGISLGYNAGLTFNAASQVMTLAGNSTVINYGGNFNLGESTGSSAVFTVTNSASINSGGSRNYIGGGAAKGVLNLNSTATSTFSTNGGQFFLGGTGGATDSGVGALNQTAGTLKFGTGTLNYIMLGDNGGTAPTSYGSFNLSGGNVSEVSGAGFHIGYGGLGSYVQSGGTLLSGLYFSIGGNTAGGNGVATFTGGTAGIFNTTYYLIVADAAGATGVLNLGTEAGGTAVITNLSVTGVVLDNNTGGNGTLNLNSGTLMLGARIYNNSTGKAVLNLNGGTLAFSSAGTGAKIIDPTLSSVNMYKGGLTLNMLQSQAVTAGANILGTTGNGVYPAGGILTVTNGGSGYIGAPLVTVSGGSGSNAMAIATISGGAVTNVVLTCPGQNYQAGDVLSFAFNGGGANTAAGTFTYTLQAGDIAANAGGGLTKTGSGPLYLTGNNTYTGTTLVSAGTLAAAGTISGPVSVASGATLAADAGTIGTLNLNNTLTLAAGSTTVMKLTASSNDQIAGLTAANYNGTLILTNTGGTVPVAGKVYQLFNSAVAGSGNFTSVVIQSTAGAFTGTFSAATGQFTVTPASTQMTIGPVTISGGNLILTASGGTANSGYTLLTTTNLLTPLAQWTTNLQGTLSATGTLSNAIPVSATTPAQFFKVRTP